MQEVDLICARNNRNFQRRIFLDVFIGMDFLWVAFGHQKTFTIAGIGNSELHLLATIRQNVLLGGDKLKALGLQSGNERAEWCDGPVNFLNSEFFKDCCGNIRANAFGGTTCVHVTVRHFVGGCSTYKTSAFQLVNRDCL